MTSMFTKHEKRDWSIKERERTIRDNQRFERLMAIEKRRAKNRQRRHELRKIRNQHRYGSERRKKFTTSKLLMYFILINCSIIELYSMWIMYHLSDISALYSLITAVVTESIAYAIYSAKSFKETKEEALCNLEREKLLYDHGINPSSPTEDTPTDEEVVDDGNDEIEPAG